MAWPSVFCKSLACRNIKLKLFHFISFTDFPRQIGGGGGGGMGVGGRLSYERVFGLT